MTQPPATALDGEVFAAASSRWCGSRRGGVPVDGVTVTATIASGSGTLEGADGDTDGAGTAVFGDLGIAGTGNHTLQFAAGEVTRRRRRRPVGAARGGEHRRVGGAGPVGHRSAPHDHVADRQDPGLGQVRAGRDDDGPAAAVESGPGRPAGAPMMANDTMLFCAGHTLMDDGRVMVSGGHKEDDRGLDVTNIFDPATESWVPGLPKMDKGRWYPTVTTLANGRIVTVAGKDTSESVVRIPEIWEGNQWVRLPGANPPSVLSPRLRGPQERSRLLCRRADHRAAGSTWTAATAGGRGRWIDGPSHIYQFNRDYGSAAMYETGKILYVGGGGDPGWDTPDPKANLPTATAEKIDLMATSPTWQDAGSMATRGATSTRPCCPMAVLVTGGISGGGGLNDITTRSRPPRCGTRPPTIGPRSRARR